MRAPGTAFAGLLRPALPLLLALSFGAGPVAGQWAEGKGRYWVKLSGFRHVTTEQYRPDGRKRRFLNSDAESRSSAVFLDALVGVTDRLDLWLQLPYFDLNFDDDAGRRNSRGIGDVRVSARYNLLRLRGGSVPVSARFTAKIPVVDFPIDAEVIPVGEGQWDYEAWLETGVSLWPVPAYAVLWLGYRWRSLNAESTRDPGDERVLLAELGGSLSGPLGAKLTVDALLGKNGSIQGIRVSGDEREIIYIQPSVTYRIRPDLALEVGARMPVRGKNFPAGPQFTVGLFHRPVPNP